VDVGKRSNRGSILRIEIPASMVGYDDAIQAMFNSQYRILSRLYTLCHNGQLRRLSKPRNVVPVECVVNVSAHRPSKTSALRIIRALRATHRRFGEGCRLDFDTLIAFSFSLDRTIDGEPYPFDAVLFCVFQESFGSRSVFVNIKLKEEGY
jgi:hypothetical protein